MTFTTPDDAKAALDDLLSARGLVRTAWRVTADTGWQHTSVELPDNVLPLSLGVGPTGVVQVDGNPFLPSELDPERPVLDNAARVEQALVHWLDLWGFRHEIDQAPAPEDDSPSP